MLLDPVMLSGPSHEPKFDVIQVEEEARFKRAFLFAHSCSVYEIIRS